ncbi:nuclear apoptosis-inducing factor 1-like isoform X1 [Onychostoma macrolepis]|uniref:nuclear apoptosis-inducing factor 1-like isoform X1 n=1 Tax=Onychostoma macrolepis TaxID=369639 RepID=UPI00272C583E|nr:nuclear apoptosis-inducing factor 1-like isoform X1 [Onychostoma macrolepis]
MEEKRNRKKNFSHEEILILIDGYKENKTVIESKLNSSVTNRKKCEIWQDITNKINAKGFEQREVKELRKKWSDLKTQAIEDFPRTKHVPTGGGPRPEPGPYSTVILEIIGDNSPTVCGITGVESGIEAADMAQTGVIASSQPTPGTCAENIVLPASTGDPPVLHADHPGSTQDKELPPSVENARKRKRANELDDDINYNRCKLLKLECAKVEEEILKIKSERKKIDLENVKINLEIIKLQEELKPHGYTFNVVEM